MKSIGGNTEIKLMLKNVDEVNQIGERVPVNKDWAVLWGWMDYMTQTTGSTLATWRSKYEDSSHVFLCDVEQMPQPVKSVRDLVAVDAYGRSYDVMMIDHVMGLKAHYEIYLDYLGG